MVIQKASDIGKAIRQKRKEIGMTQTEAAGLCNVGIRFLSELENGKPTLEIDKVLQVVSMFGFSMSMRNKT